MISSSRELSLPFDTSEAILVKVFSLVDVVLDTIWYGVAANEALGRVVTMATLTLKRAVGLGIETLASQRGVTKVAYKARVVIVVVVVQRHLFASFEALSAFFASNIQWIQHVEASFLSLLPSFVSLFV